MLSRTLSSFTIMSLFKMLEENLINLNPPYQRKSGKWNPNKESHFIGSLLNNDTPGVLFYHQFPNSNIFNQVDGKQRVTTISKFFQGQVRLPSDFVYERNPNLPLIGLSWMELAEQYEEVVSDFLSKEISYEIFITDDIGRISRQFINLNSGEKVKASEKRHAIIGEGMNWIRNMTDEVTGHPFFRQTIKIANKSFEWEDMLCRILLAELQNSLLHAKSSHLDKLMHDLINPNTELLASFRAAQSRIINILDFISHSFSANSPCFDGKVSTVTYYWLIRYARSEWNWTGEQARKFLDDFSQARKDNRMVDPILENKALTLYAFLMSNGTSHKSNVKDRYTIVYRFADIFNRRGSVSFRDEIEYSDLVTYRYIETEEPVAV